MDDDYYMEGKKCSGKSYLRKVKGHSSKKRVCLSKSAMKKIVAGGRKGGKRSHKSGRKSGRKSARKSGRKSARKSGRKSM